MSTDKDPSQRPWLKSTQRATFAPVLAVVLMTLLPQPAGARETATDDGRDPDPIAQISEDTCGLRGDEFDITISEESTLEDEITHHSNLEHLRAPHRRRCARKLLEYLQCVVGTFSESEREANNIPEDLTDIPAGTHLPLIRVPSFPLHDPPGGCVF